MSAPYSATGFNLPQIVSASELASRQTELATRKTIYNYHLSYALYGIRSLQSNQNIYTHDKEASVWLNAKASATLSINAAVNGVSDSLRKDSILQAMIDAENAFVADQTTEKLQVMNALNPGMMTETEAKARSISDYAALTSNAQWVKTPREMGAEIFDDATFARMCVAGAAPTIIERVTPEKLNALKEAGFSDELTASNIFFSAESLDSLMAQQRLFVEDFKMLKEVLPDVPGIEELEAQLGIRNTQYDPTSPTSEHRYLFAPIALYALTNEVDISRRRLLPLGIKCGQLDYSGPDPILHPNLLNRATYADHINKTDETLDYRWQMAKTIVLNAQHVYHESFEHLGGTHLLVEAYALACRRCLPDKHPINGLMVHHFRSAMSVNYAGIKTLVPDGSVGWVSEIYSCKKEAFLRYTAQALKDFDLSRCAIPDDIERRGVGSDVLPYYPYRDDALLMWNTIKSYVVSFVDYFYIGDANQNNLSDIAGDDELIRFVLELSAPQTLSNGVVLAGLNILPSGTLGNFNLTNATPEEYVVACSAIKGVITKQWLYDLVSLFIFKASAGHAAANYNQCGRLNNCVWYPAAITMPTPIGASTRTDYLEMLPSNYFAKQQVKRLTFLGFNQVTQTGFFNLTSYALSALDANWYFDTRIRTFVTQFTSKLKNTVETTINARNAALPDVEEHYSYLLPSRTPRSIFS